MQICNKYKKAAYICIINHTPTNNDMSALENITRLTAKKNINNQSRITPELRTALEQLHREHTLEVTNENHQYHPEADYLTNLATSNHVVISDGYLCFHIWNQSAPTFKMRKVRSYSIK